MWSRIQRRCGAPPWARPRMLWPAPASRRGTWPPSASPTSAKRSCCGMPTPAPPCIRPSAGKTAARPSGAGRWWPRAWRMASAPPPGCSSIPTSRAPSSRGCWSKATCGAAPKPERCALAPLTPSSSGGSRAAGGIARMRPTRRAPSCTTSPRTLGATPCWTTSTCPWRCCRKCGRAWTTSASAKRGGWARTSPSSAWPVISRPRSSAKAASRPA